MTTTRTEQPTAGSERAAQRRGVPWPRAVAGIAGGLLRSWVRDPGIVVQSLVFPAFLLAMFQLVLGKTVTSMGGGESVYANTGLVALTGGLFGGLSTAIALAAERETGVLARQWTLPVPRAAFLSGRLCAEMIRVGVSTVVLYLVAMTMGFRFDQGFLAALGALAVPMIFTAGLAAPITAMALRTNGAQTIQLVGGLSLLLLFFNSGFAPVAEYPDVLQPVVRYQPMTPAVDAIKALTEGGAITAPLLGTVAWTVVLIAAFGPLVVRGFRRAAATS